MSKIYPNTFRQYCGKPLVRFSDGSIVSVNGSSSFPLYTIRNAGILLDHFHPSPNHNNIKEVVKNIYKHEDTIYYKSEHGKFVTYTYDPHIDTDEIVTKVKHFSIKKSYKNFLVGTNRIMRIPDMTVIDLPVSNDSEYLNYVIKHDKNYLVVCMFYALVNNEAVPILNGASCKNIADATGAFMHVYIYNEDLERIYNPRFVDIVIPYDEHLKITKKSIKKQMKTISDAIVINYDRIKVDFLTINMHYKDECCICFNLAPKHTIKPCGHDEFCKKCISKVMHCPLCRAEIFQ